jgi:ferritin-like protein
MIDALCRQAEADKDFATANKLVWFVDEQVEEEQNAQDIIDSLKMVDDSKMGLYMIDKELAARAYTAPSIAGA